MDISQALEAVSKSETIKLKQIIENYAAANSLEAVHDEVRILKSGKNYCLRLVPGTRSYWRPGTYGRSRICCLRSYLLDASYERMPILLPFLASTKRETLG
jgi:hypothetical protein